MSKALRSRVRASALVLGADGLLRSGARAGTVSPGPPFTGLAYRVSSDGILESIVEVHAGAITGVSTDWIGIPQGGLRVDGAILDAGEGYGPFLLHGTPFNGATYDFEASGACTGETLYQDGFPTDTSQRAWYESGAPEEFVSGGDYMSWFEDGRLKRRAIGDKQIYNVIVRENGCLGGLYLVDKSFFDLEAVRRLAFDDEVMLIGSAIDVGVLQTLRDQAGLRQVRQLRLVETGIGSDGIDVLVSLGAVRALWLTKNPALGRSEADLLRARRADWEVHLELAPVP